MIRLATLETFEEPLLKELMKSLYTAFGVGCELVGPLDMPAGLKAPLDAQAFLGAPPPVKMFPDDKVLYLTSWPLKIRPSAVGPIPTFGLAQYRGPRALLSTAMVKNPLEQFKVVSRHALQELGHTWGLHHCLDPRCAMYVQWVPGYPAGEPIFCVYCREKSEAVIRLAKS